MTRVPAGNFSYMKSSPYGIRRGADRRLSVTTRSRRDSISCLSSACLSSLSFASGRAIKSSPQPVLGLRPQLPPQAPGLAVRSEMQNRPLPAERGRGEPPIRIHRHWMAERGEEGQIVMGIGIPPASREIELTSRTVFRAPARLFVAGHHRRPQATGCATPTVREPIRGVVRNVEAPG